jgi:surface antigen
MRAAAPAIAVILAVASAGCSVSFPIMGLSSKAEDEIVTTSSIAPAPASSKPVALASLAHELGPEDLRRADGAMTVALDPQGNGAPVSWDNPQSGAKGSFTPVGGPFVRSDEICRAFIAHVQTQTKPARLQGTACRPSGGEWAVKDMQPFKSAV